eukprot:jgi/Tetstr1/425574/TSEL_001548.t1
MPLAQGTLSLRVSSLKWLGEMLPSGMKPEEAAPFVTVHFERRGEQPLEVLRTIRKVFHNHVRPGELLRLGKLAKMKLDNRWELYDEVLVAHEVTAFIVCVRVVNEHGREVVLGTLRFLAGELLQNSSHVGGHARGGIGGVFRMKHELCATLRSKRQRAKAYTHLAAPGKPCAGHFDSCTSHGGCLCGEGNPPAGMLCTSQSVLAPCSCGLEIQMQLQLEPINTAGSFWRHGSSSCNCCLMK